MNAVATRKSLNQCGSESIVVLVDLHVLVGVGASTWGGSRA